MTPNFTHKILNAEIPPPVSAWDKIAAELEKLEGSGFVHKLSEAAIEPPASVWQRVANELDGPQRAKRISLNRNWKKLAAAAVVVGLIIIGLNYLITDKPSNQVATKESDTKNPRSSTVVPPSNNASSSSAEATTNPNARLADNSRQNNSRKPISAKRGQSESPLRHAMIESSGNGNGTKLPPENEPRISNNVSSTPATFIPPPEYYFVTAPNGERVRISSKFSDGITSLYGGDNVDYFWKWRFDSWKSKIMSNPSFIPSAGNFLDIVELKDMLKEQ